MPTLTDLAPETLCHVATNLATQDLKNTILTCRYLSQNLSHVLYRTVLWRCEDDDSRSLSSSWMRNCSGGTIALNGTALRNALEKYGSQVQDLTLCCTSVDQMYGPRPSCRKCLDQTQSFSVPDAEPSATLYPRFINLKSLTLRKVSNLLILNMPLFPQLHTVKLLSTEENGGSGTPEISPDSTPIEHLLRQPRLGHLLLEGVFTHKGCRFFGNVDAPLLRHLVVCDSLIPTANFLSMLRGMKRLQTLLVTIPSDGKYLAPGALQTASDVGGEQVEDYYLGLGRVRDSVENLFLIETRSRLGELQWIYTGTLADFGRLRYLAVNPQLFLQCRPCPYDHRSFVTTRGVRHPSNFGEVLPRSLRMLKLLVDVNEANKFEEYRIHLAQSILAEYDRLVALEVVICVEALALSTWPCEECVNQPSNFRGCYFRPVTGSGWPGVMDDEESSKWQHLVATYKSIGVSLQRVMDDTCFWEVKDMLSALQDPGVN